MSSSEIAHELGHEKISGALKKAIKSLLDKEAIEYTVPGKPRSQMQKYRIKKK